MTLPVGGLLEVLEPREPGGPYNREHENCQEPDSNTEACDPPAAVFPSSVGDGTENTVD